MVRNPVGDSETFSATYWSSFYNAHNQEAILNGLVPSKGTGDFDIDTTSGEAIVQSTKTGTIGAQTPAVTLSSADPSDDRVDLVHVDSGGTITATEGTPATDPNAPDIPSGEVLIAAVLVEGGASSLNSAGSKIADYRTIYENNPAFDSIEDGSGTARFEAATAETRLNDETGANAFVAQDSQYYRWFARTGTPAVLRDAVGGFDAMTYTPGASAPNTFDWGGNDLTNINTVRAENADTRSGYTDETGNRSFGVWYQNTNDSDLDVSVVVQADTGTPTAEVVLDINDTQNSKRVDGFRKVLDATEFEFLSVNGVVPDESFYRVRAAGDTADFSIIDWKEQK